MTRAVPCLLSLFALAACGPTEFRPLDERIAEATCALTDRCEPGAISDIEACENAYLRDVAAGHPVTGTPDDVDACIEEMDSFPCERIHDSVLHLCNGILNRF